MSLSPKQKAIVVLGYSLKRDGTLEPLLISRLDTAIELYRPGLTMILSGKMPLAFYKEDRCETKTEAAAMREYLVTKGVLAEDILLEEYSTSTLTNAYYTRLLYLDPLNITEVVVVSNSFHMPLVQYCFAVVLGKKISFKTYSAPDSGFSAAESRRHSNQLRELSEKCYPLIFNNIHNGDMAIIQKIIDEAEISSSEERIKFERCLREIFSIDTKVSLKGMI